MKPQLSLRDLFWLVLVVALAVGWWNQSRQNWLGAHARWRRIYDAGLMDKEPKQVNIEYTDSGTSEMVFPAKHDETTRADGGGARRGMLKESLVIRDVHTLQDLEAALAAPRAVIHIDVDWSAQAVRSRPVIQGLAESASRQAGLADIPFYRLDFTEQEGPVWDAFAAWQERERSDRSLRFGGYGAVVWIENGHPKDAVHDAHVVGQVGLLQRTMASFGSLP